MKEMIMHAEARASILYATPEEVPELVEAIQEKKQPKIINKKYFTYKAGNYHQEYQRWVQEQLENLKKKYPRMDQNELRKHQRWYKSRMQKLKSESQRKKQDEQEKLYQ